MKRIIFYAIILTIISSFLCTFLVNSNFILFNRGESISKTRLESEHKDIEFLLLNAKEAYYKCEFEESQRLYMKVLEEEKSNIFAIKNLIFINKELGKLNQAIFFNKKLLFYDKENLKYKYMLGINLYQAGKIIEAYQILNEINNKINNETSINSSIDSLSLKEKSLLYFYLSKIEILLSNLNNALDYANKSIKIYP
jgi:tetratricopeptide (TPR) repeat protein